MIARVIVKDKRERQERKIERQERNEHEAGREEDSKQTHIVDERRITFN